MLEKVTVNTTVNIQDLGHQLIEELKRSSPDSLRIGKLIFQGAVIRMKDFSSVCTYLGLGKNLYQDIEKIGKIFSHHADNNSYRLQQDLVNHFKGKELYHPYMGETHPENSFLLQTLAYTGAGKNPTVFECFTLLLSDPSYVHPEVDNNYAIRLASFQGHAEMVKLLLADKRVSSEADDDFAIKWAAANGHLEVVKLLLADERVHPEADDNFAIQGASESGHVEVVRLLLSDERVSPESGCNHAIYSAATKGHIEIVKLLLSDKRVATGDIYSEVIGWASGDGHLALVELFLPDSRVTPEACNYAIQFASEDGHVEMVKLLLSDKRVSPEAEGNLAIRKASENGHVEVVKLLLSDKRVSPEAEDNLAIRGASENGHVEVVKLLLMDPRVNQQDNATRFIECAIENSITCAIKNGYAKRIPPLLVSVMNHVITTGSLKASEKYIAWDHIIAFLEDKSIGTNNQTINTTYPALSSIFNVAKPLKNSPTEPALLQVAKIVSMLQQQHYNETQLEDFVRNLATLIGFVPENLAGYNYTAWFVANIDHPSQRDDFAKKLEQGFPNHSDPISALLAQAGEGMKYVYQKGMEYYQYSSNYPLNCYYMLYGGIIPTCVTALTQRKVEYKQFREQLKGLVNALVEQWMEHKAIKVEALTEKIVDMLEQNPKTLRALNSTFLHAVNRTFLNSEPVIQKTVGMKVIQEFLATQHPSFTHVNQQPSSQIASYLLASEKTAPSSFVALACVNKTMAKQGSWSECLDAARVARREMANHGR